MIPLVHIRVRNGVIRSRTEVVRVDGEVRVQVWDGGERLAGRGIIRQPDVDRVATAREAVEFAGFEDTEARALAQGERDAAALRVIEALGPAGQDFATVLIADGKLDPARARAQGWTPPERRRR